MNKLIIAAVIATGCAYVPVRPTDDQDHSNTYRETGRWPGSPVVKTLLGSGIQSFGVSGQNITVGAVNATYLGTTGAVPGLAGATNVYVGSYDVARAGIWLLQHGVAPTATNYAMVADGSTLTFGGANADYKVVASNAASGQNAFQVTTNGARIDFGAGASDYASSDGTTVTYAGPIASAGSIWAKGDFFNTTNGTLLVSHTAPTISSGFGTSPSIVASNGTASFQINVGTGGVATTGVIGLPTATTGWVCTCEDVTTQNTTVARTRQTGLGTTTTCPIGDFTSADVAGAWAASDKLVCQAFAY
jgi:hypothetical protein